MDKESGLIYAYAYGPGFKSSYWMTQFFPQFLKFLSLMRKAIVLWFALCCFCCLFRFAVDFYTHCCRALTLALARLSFYKFLYQSFLFYNTAKPKIFVCSLFREFRNLRKFAKITGREYSNVNHLLSTSLIEPNTKTS